MVCQNIYISGILYRVLTSLTDRTYIDEDTTIQVFFSVSSAYNLFFNGSVHFEPWRRLCKSWAPSKCKIFLWLATKDKCWTSYNLIKRDLPYPEHCVLCDQETQTIQHILVECVFAREFWFRLLSFFDLQHHSPDNIESNFA